MNPLLKAFLIAPVAILLGTVCVYTSQTDERIESSAKNSYVFKTYLKEDSINATSKEGVVTLTGSVNEESHKSLAQETVSNLPGVVSVDNKIVVNQQPEERSDNWLSMKVKGSLLYNRNVSGLTTMVYVKDGVATLKGEADSQAQKDLTGAYAKEVSGIKDVINEMTIAKTDKQTMGEKIDDASITAQVKVALMSHHSTSAFNTKVSTVNGVVTISGNAKNSAEKDLVTKLVNDIHGVSQVINNMTIAEKIASK